MARLTTAEDGTQKLSSDLDAHRTEIVAQNERRAKLMEDLRGAFDRQASEILGLRAEQQEQAKLIEALQTGLGGRAGPQLVDTRIMDGHSLP